MKEFSDVSMALEHGFAGPVTFSQNPAHSAGRKASFLSDEVYAEVLNGTSVTCTDVVIIDVVNKTIYLAERLAYPMRGKWWLGGRMRGFQHFLDAAHANFVRETKFNIDRSRIVSLGGGAIIRCMWSERAQEPVDNGSDTISFMYGIFDMTPDELALVEMGLDQNEYDTTKGLKAYGRDELEALLAAGQLHPGIMHVYNQIFPEA